MSNQSTARMFDRLREGVRQRDEQIKTLSQENERTRRQFVEVETLSRQLTSATSAIRQLADLNEKATRRIESLETSRQALISALKSSETMRLAAIAERDQLEISLSTVAPQLKLIAEQRADLNRILDQVRDRMRRKDQANERAVLNRRVISAVVPKRNFR